MDKYFFLRFWDSFYFLTFFEKLLPKNFKNFKCQFNPLKITFSKFWKKLDDRRHRKLQFKKKNEKKFNHGWEINVWNHCPNLPYKVWLSEITLCYPMHYFAFRYVFCMLTYECSFGRYLSRHKTWLQAKIMHAGCIDLYAYLFWKTKKIQ